MTHGSLFSGIGGFDLAAEWMGWDNVFHCEWNKFGQQVLKYYWHNSISYDDITKTDFTIHRGSIDILTGGFPCQPYSSAGKRLGKEDERHLWPEMLRAIREIQPRWVVGENVLGLVNWSGGLVFHEVQADLEAEGYEVQPFVLPAVSVNAPHRRDRVWFVAHSGLFRQEKSRKQSMGIEQLYESWDAAYSNNPRTNIGMRSEREWSQNDNERQGQPFFEYRENGSNGDAANTNLYGFNERNSNNEINPSKRRINAFGDINESNGDGDASDTENQRLEGLRREKGRYSELYRGQYGIPNWQNFPSVSPICSGDDGLSDRLDSITFPKWRNESIKAGGNAIVPQVVYQIFKTIEQYEREHITR